MDASDPAVDQVLQADADWQAYQQQYDSLLRDWDGLKVRRETLITHLLATRVMPGATSAVAAPAEAPGHAAALAVPASAAVGAASATAAASPPPSWSDAPAPTARRPKPVRATPRKLTAPNLLGVSGAALLIAAALVFIAITWATISPVLQALAILAVAAGTATLSRWLTRQDLPVSGGAVGVVAMTFAGVSVIGFDRGTDLFGSYVAPAAMAITTLAGIVMSRQGIRWVGSTAAASLMGIGVGFTFASSDVLSFTHAAQWAVTGALTSLAVLASYQIWRTDAQRAVVKYGAVGWISATAIPAVFNGSAGADLALPTVVAALFSVILLVVLASWWPLVTLGPATVLFTALSASSSYLAGGTAWLYVAGAAIAAGIISLVGRRVRSEWAPPILWGLLPAFVAGVIGTVAAVIGVTVSFLFFGSPVNVGQTSLWAGAATLLLAAACGAFQWWQHGTGVARSVQVMGAIAATAGAPLLAYAIVDLNFTGRSHALALGLLCAGLAIAATAMMFRDSAARWTAVIGATAWTTVSGLVGAYVLATNALPLPAGIAVAFAAVAILAVAATRFPRVTAGPAAFLATYSVGALILAVGGGQAQMWAGAAAVGAMLLWATFRLPARWRLPVSLGAVPAVLVSAFITLGSAIRVFERFSDGGSSGAIEAASVWPSLSGIFAAVGLAAFARMDALTSRAAAISGIGVAMVLAGAVTGTYVLAGALGLSGASSVAVSGATIALLVAAVVMMWPGSGARWGNGIGATGLLTIAGLNGAAALADPDGSLWLGIATVVGPIVVLAVFARWWPRLTLGPAALLATVGAASGASHANLPVAAHVTAALAAAASVAWLVTFLAPRFIRPLLVGTVPAVIVGGLWVAAVALQSMAATLSGSGGELSQRDATWALAAALLLVIAMASSRRLAQFGQLAAAAALVGSVAVLGAAVVGTALLAPTWDGANIPMAAAALACTIGAAIAIPVWRERPMRYVSGIGLVAWLTATQARGLFDLYWSPETWRVGLSVAAIAIALLVTFGRWWPRVTLASAAFLFTAAALAGLGHWAAPEASLLMLSGAVVGVAWIAAAVTRGRRLPLIYGVAPASVAVAAVLAWNLPVSLANAVGLLDSRFERIEYWTAALAVAGAAAVFAWKPARERAGWVALPFAAVAAAHVPQYAAWMGLAALGAIAVIFRQRLRTPPEAVLIYVVGSLTYTRAPRDLAIAALIGFALALWTAAHVEGNRKQGALALVPAFAAAAAAGGAATFGATQAFIALAGLVAAMAGAVLLARSRLAPLPIVTRSVVAATALGIPPLAGSLSAIGMLMLVSGAAMLTMAVLGWRPARFLTALAFSLGSALIFADAGVTVIEAYSGVPALTTLGVGLWWLSDDARMRTFAALSPGLGLLVLPSVVALALDVNHVARTLAMTGGILLLAWWGVKARWFAPVIAAAVGAASVSVTQVIGSSTVVPIWISLGTVGALLVTLAATYEKLKDLR